MIALLNNTSAVQNQDKIRILHGGNTLCDDDLGGIRKLLTECLADEGIGLGIHRRGRIIQDQNTRFFQ